MKTREQLEQYRGRIINVLATETINGIDYSSNLYGTVVAFTNHEMQMRIINNCVIWLQYEQIETVYES